MRWSLSSIVPSWTWTVPHRTAPCRSLAGCGQRTHNPSEQAACWQARRLSRCGTYQPAAQSPGVRPDRGATVLPAPSQTCPGPAVLQRHQPSGRIPERPGRRSARRNGLGWCDAESWPYGVHEGCQVVPHLLSSFITTTYAAECNCFRSRLSSPSDGRTTHRRAWPKYPPFQSPKEIPVARAVCMVS